MLNLWRLYNNVFFKDQFCVKEKSKRSTENLSTEVNDNRLLNISIVK